MLLRFAFAPLAVALITACSGEVASVVAGDGGHAKGDSGHAASDAEPNADAGEPGHDAAQRVDGGGGHDGDLASPTNHRPSHVGCMSTRPPGLQDGGGFDYPPADDCCTSDSQCPATNDAGGTNGRCTPPEDDGPVVTCPSCRYDQCSTDSQCGTEGVCECGGEAQTGRYPNICLSGNCQIDSDCGQGGYCSPDVGFCGEGILGYYCHTPGDQCTNDSDCLKSPGSFGGQCVYDTTKRIWDCQGEGCPG